MALAPSGVLELGWGELEAVRGGEKEAAVLCSPGSAHPSCPSPKKAEQDIELWKKQEAAAKDAESGSPGSEQQPEVRVPHICVLVGSQPSSGWAEWWGKD